MDDGQASAIAQHWAGDYDLVPRGPRMLLGFGPAEPSDVERHTGRRPRIGSVWRVEVGGRFLRSGAVVYPGGVPYPEDLHERTPIVSSEVWLYVSEPDGDVIGSYAWPEAVRRPVAAAPRQDFDPDDVRHPSDLAAELDFELRVPCHPSVDPVLAVALRPWEAVVLCVRDTIPDPLNEMVLFEQGGVSLRADARATLDASAVLRDHQPPFRSVRVGRAAAVGREPGRALGPQTWPWPAELLWAEDGVRYELKGSVPLATLQEIAATMRPVTAR